MQLKESLEKPENCLNCSTPLFAQDGEPLPEALILKKEKRGVIGDIYLGGWCNMHCFLRWAAKHVRKISFVP